MIDFTVDGVLKNIRDMARWFAQNELRPRALKADRECKVDDDFILMVHKMGIAAGGSQLPAGLVGGSGGGGEHREKITNRAQIVGAEELASGDAAAVTSFPGPGLGGPPVQFTGTKEQQERFFSIFKQDQPPRWGAYALTEPGAGSDVAALSTTCRKEGSEYVINGRKVYITNGARADWVVCFATIDKNLGRAGQRAFVVEKGTPGFKVGRIEKKLGLRASETAELWLEECRVPEANLLGGEDHYEKRAKGGFTTAMKTFDSTRPLVAIMAVGIARCAYELTLDHAKQNLMLNRPLAAYDPVRDALVEMNRKIRAARLLCLRAAWMADMGIPNTMEASMSKAYAAKIGQEVTSKCVELLGLTGTRHDAMVEKCFRDMKVYDIFEGTGEIQRLIISRKLMPDIRIP